MININYQALSSVKKKKKKKTNFKTSTYAIVIRTLKSTLILPKKMCAKQITAPDRRNVLIKYLLKQFLPLKCHAKFVADDIQIFFSEKISLDISCKSSAKQTIHMKYRLVFSEK